MIPECSEYELSKLILTAHYIYNPPTPFIRGGFQRYAPADIGGWGDLIRVIYIQIP